MVPSQAMPYCERRVCSLHEPDQKFKDDNRLTSSVRDGHSGVGLNTNSLVSSPVLRIHLSNFGRYVMTLPVCYCEYLTTT
jgi:hypothetical protein